MEIKASKQRRNLMILNLYLQSWMGKETIWSDPELRKIMDRVENEGLFKKTWVDSHMEE